jgi:TolB protein
MKKPVETLLQITLILAAVGGLEYSFFRAPSVSAEAAGVAPPESVRAATAETTVQDAAAETSEQATAPLQSDGEKHLTNIKQLTFGGENAEAYWSFDGKKISFQSTRDGSKADQIYVMDADGSNVRRISSGEGRTTCSYFTKDGRRVIYASTHLGGAEPPPPPDMSQGYVWAVYPTYDIFSVRLDGSGLRRLTDTPGYDAEGTISPDGKRIVFTSMRDGDLDLYSMDLDGKNVQRLTRELGYDGGAFFSPDGTQICYRAGHPKTPEEETVYKDLLAKNLVKPSKMELWVMNADGSNKRQVTFNGAANFCPFFTPDGRRLIFASNVDDPRGRNFDLYLIDRDGKTQEKITTDPTFDGFPMFSPDGKKLVWASNRNAKTRGDTNIFVADWVP